MLILGAGPAGSTLAATLLRHRPGLRVALVDRGTFPRYHIGESLLLDSMNILRETGAYDAVEQAGFLKKVGATYVWGQDREPWGLDFGDLDALDKPESSDLSGIPHAFQVERHRYDKILLDHAVSLGAVFYPQHTATDLVWEGKRLTGVHLRTPTGGTMRVDAGLVADCTGQNSLVARAMDVRRKDQQLDNLAIWAYYRGAAWKYRYHRHQQYSRIFICTVPGGWVWTIPLREDLMSVGLVVPRGAHPSLTLGKATALLDGALQSPDLAPLFAHAERLSDYAGSGREVHVAQDWSYTSTRMAGPGWVLAGDAAGFLDPILSTGCHFAHVGGYLAAYTHLSAMDAPARKAALYWREYTRFYQEMLATYRRMAKLWYRNNPSVDNWWAQAGKWVRTTRTAGVDDFEAFVMLVSGFSGGEVYGTYDAHLEAFGTKAGHHVARQLMGRVHQRSGTPAPNARPRFTADYRLVPAVTVRRGTGTLREMVRLKITRPPKGVPRFERLLLPQQARWLELIDGHRTMKELTFALEKLCRAAGEDLPRDAADATAILADLHRMGVLALDD